MLGSGAPLDTETGATIGTDAHHGDGRRLGTGVMLGTLVTLGSTPDAGEPDQVDAAPVVL